MLIHGIVGTVVYLNFTNCLPNNAIAGKSQIITNTVAGSFLGWVYLIASNLTGGTHDPVFSGLTYKIKGTKPITIGGAARTVNHLNVRS